MFYCLFFVVSHLGFCLLFSTQGGLAIEKRKARYTPIQGLLKDIKAIYIKVLPLLIKSAVAWLFLYLYYHGLLLFMGSMGSFLEMLSFVFALYFSVLHHIVYLLLIFLSSNKNKPSVCAHAILRKSFLNFYLLKKLRLFNLQIKTKQKGVFLYLLWSVSYLNVVRTLPYTLAGLSFYNDLGRSIACYYFLISLITYLLTDERFSSKIKERCGPKGLRLLGWNIVRNIVSSTGAKAVVVGTAGAAAFSGDRMLGNSMDADELEDAANFDVKKNYYVDRIKLKDPVNRETYVYSNTVSEVQPKRSALKHLLCRLETGSNPVASALKKKKTL